MHRRLRAALDDWHAKRRAYQEADKQRSAARRALSRAEAELAVRDTERQARSRARRVA